MREGWIKLHRSLLDWEWYDDIPTKCLFFHFLLSANHSPSKWRGIAIGRGQMWTSIGSLSKKCGLTPKQVRVAMEKLENTGEVKSEGASNGTMITICKYDTYQSFEETEGKPRGKGGAKEGQGEGKVGATNNKNNNPKNDEEEQELKGASAPTHPLNVWIAKDCPRVARMKQPLTDSEAIKLEADFGIDSAEKAQVLKDLILSMQNYAGLHKSLSANLTIRNWWKRDRERGVPIPLAADAPRSRPADPKH